MDNRTLEQKMIDRYKDQSLTASERAITKAWLVKNNVFDINPGYESSRPRQPAKQKYDWGDPVKPKPTTTDHQQDVKRAQYDAANKARKIIHEQVRERIRNEYRNYQHPKTVEVNSTTTGQGGGMCLFFMIMAVLFTLKYIFYG